MDPPPAASAAPHDATSLPPSPPRRGPGHRRAQSEILLGAALPNDLAFDADLGVVGEDFDDDDDADEGGHLFAELLDAGKLDEPPEPGQHPPAPARPRHQHSLSMDGSTSAASGRAAAEAKKAVSDAKLAELALVDPKRAKRILANRQSAARSKERKMRYIGELERKVQALQTDATTLSAQLSMLKGDTTSLTSENSELKLQLQTMEQQVRLQDALNDRLRDEIQQLKIATGQVTANSGKMGSFGVSSFGANPRIYQRNHVQSLLVSQQLQLQQLQIHSQQHQQQQMHMQQQHQSLAHHQELLQEAVSLSGDMKMKGIAMTSHTQDGCSSDCYALESEP